MRRVFIQLRKHYFLRTFLTFGYISIGLCMFEIQFDGRLLSVRSALQIKITFEGSIKYRPLEN